MQQGKQIKIKPDNVNDTLEEKDEEGMMGSMPDPEEVTKKDALEQDKSVGFNLDASDEDQSHVVDTENQAREEELRRRGFDIKADKKNKSLNVPVVERDKVK